MLQILHVSDFHLTSGIVQSFGSLGAWIKWASSVPPLAHYYTTANRRIQRALAVELARIAASQPTQLVLSGDIAAWPGDSSNVINSVYYNYVAGLRNALVAGCQLFAVLGNHDWGDGLPFQHTTNFVATQFQQQYQIIDSRVYRVQAGGLNAVFFLIDSNVTMVPATGYIAPGALNFLQQAFQNVRTRMSPQEYEGAVKILVLHHSPLPYSAYDLSLTRREGRQLELTNAQNLLSACKDDIDVFLFGHTHIPTRQVYDGFVMLDGGTTLGSTFWTWFPANLNLLRIVDSDTIDVQSLSWVRTHFSSHGTKVTTFRRGAGSSTSLGRGRWG